MYFCVNGEQLFLPLRFQQTLCWTSSGYKEGTNGDLSRKPCFVFWPVTQIIAEQLLEPLAC